MSIGASARLRRGSLGLDDLRWLHKNEKAQGRAEQLAELKACSLTRDVQWGRRIHARAVQSGNDTDNYVATALIKMYAKCGRVLDAGRVFRLILKPDVASWTALILGHADNGEGRVSLNLFTRMKAEGCVPNSVTYVAALKACTSLAVNGDEAEALNLGRSIHLETGCHSNFYVQNTLIDMYAKCGSIVDARQVFDTVQKPDLTAWTALLMGYADNGEGQVALDLFSKMKADGCAPDSKAYVAALKACTSLAVNGGITGKLQGLEVGRNVHSQIGHHMDSYVQNTLINMYAKCGSMHEALQVFRSIRKPNVVSWTALLLGYAENGEGHNSLQLFFKMKAEKCTPNSVTYVAALKACTSLAENGDKVQGLELGREIHLEIADPSVPSLQSTLIDMYAKCGSMAEARQVFDSIEKPDVVSWNTLLLGHVENGEAAEVLDLLARMKATRCKPESLTYVAALKACGSIGALGLGRRLHLEISDFPVHVVTCLVDLYAKCGSMVEARAVFDLHAESRDVTTWSALLSGYSSCGDTGSVFNLFEAMQDLGFRPDGVTFVCILLCCSHAGLVKKARQYLEAMPVQYGITPDVFHYNCMVDVLGRANQLFEVIAVLRTMPCSPNAVTWSALLGVCRKWKNVGIGRMAFQSLLEMNKDASAYVSMAHIYGSRGIRKEHEMPLAKWKRAYVVEDTGRMVSFVVGDEDPAEVTDRLADLLESMKELGYAAAESSCNAAGAAAVGQKDEAECGHCARRAVVYGILKTPAAEPVRAFKNTRMCDGCHDSIKMFSRLCGRVLMVRDTSRFHVMVNGSCSCGDRLSLEAAAALQGDGE